MFSPVAAHRPVRLPAPIEMTPEQRSRVLEHKNLIVDWLGKVYEHEYSQHMKGFGTWGKLVKGQNARKWANPNTVEANLSIMLNGDIYVPNKVKSPAQVETALKAMGFSLAQAKAKIKDMVSVIPGKPSLVANDAKGKAVQPDSGMFLPQGGK